jgi:hypothetical protein
MVNILGSWLKDKRSSRFVAFTAFFSKFILIRDIKNNVYKSLIRGNPLPLPAFNAGGEEPREE